MSAPAPNPGPLRDLVAVELAEGTAGPFVAKMLADFGAEVIKVETSRGDATRRRGPFPDGVPDPEASGLFHYLNTNKLGIVLDVENADGQAALERLLAGADIFVTDLPRQRLEAAGLEPERLRARLPRLVVATLAPFGQVGDWADRAGEEIVSYAMGGIAYATPGMPDAAEDLEGEPPLRPSCFAAETIAGIVGANAVLAAVLGRGRSGTGCHVDLSVQAAVAAMQQRDITTTSYLGSRYVRVLDPVTIGRMPNFYLACSDGYVVVAAPLESHWTRLVEAMGSPQWAAGAAFSTEAARTRNWRDLRERLTAWTMSLTGEELYAIAVRTQLPIFPFYPLRRTVDSEHVAARASLAGVVLGGREARMPGAPVAMRATPWSLRRPAPRLGEHTDMVLARQGESA